MEIPEFLVKDLTNSDIISPITVMYNFSLDVSNPNNIITSIEAIANGGLTSVESMYEIMSNLVGADFDIIRLNENGVTHQIAIDLLASNAIRVIANPAFEFDSVLIKKLMGYAKKSMEEKRKLLEE